MKQYVIKQKMSGTGTIHDLASDLSDRVIPFRGSAKYAVVIAAYYGGRGWWTHTSEEATIRDYRRLSARGYNPQIIDVNGNYYEPTGYYRDTLRARTY